jgi:NADH-quinone oxidoreductase subunit F
VEEVIQRYRGEPAALITLLIEVSRITGGLSEPALNEIGSRLGLSGTDLKATALAHRLWYSTEPPPLGLCVNTPCAARGGAEVERILREKGVAFESLRCPGSCDLGPIACFRHGSPQAISAARARSLAKAELADWEDLLSVEKPVHAFRTNTRVAFANIFAKGSHQLATARRHGVWTSAAQALERGPEAVVTAVAESGLSDEDGEGGVGRLWSSVRERGEAGYLVANGARGEPGTFQDRLLLERDPHLVLAGLVVAASATGVHEAFVCVRAEHELAAERIRGAVDEATRAGLLGERVLGRPFALKVRVRLISKAYLAGETTGLLETLEGRPPTPRPSSQARTLLGRPVLVHDLETLALVTAIANSGPGWYRSQGVNGGAGVKLVSLSGDLKRPGGYEVPQGSMLRDLLELLGGGPAQGKSLTAIQIGGALGPLVPASMLDTPLNREELEKLGVTANSGALVAITEKSCLYDIARREVAFFARESCGTCEACRLASQYLEAVEQWGAGIGAQAHIEEIVARLRASTACSLGRRAPAAVESLMRHFPTAAAEHAAGACACSPRRKPRPS